MITATFSCCYGLDFKTQEPMEFRFLTVSEKKPSDYNSVDPCIVKSNYYVCIL